MELENKLLLTQDQQLTIERQKQKQLGYLPL
jgi:hypothetical protein